MIRYNNLLTITINNKTNVHILYAITKIHYQLLALYSATCTLLGPHPHMDNPIKRTHECLSIGM